MDFQQLKSLLQRIKSTSRRRRELLPYGVSTSAEDALADTVNNLELHLQRIEEAGATSEVSVDEGMLTAELENADRVAEVKHQSWFQHWLDVLTMRLITELRNAGDLEADAAREGPTAMRMGFPLRLSANGQGVSRMTATELQSILTRTRTSAQRRLRTVRGVERYNEDALLQTVDQLEAQLAHLSQIGADVDDMISTAVRLAQNPFSADLPTRYQTWDPDWNWLRRLVARLVFSLDRAGQAISPDPRPRADNPLKISPAKPPWAR